MSPGRFVCIRIYPVLSTRSSVIETDTHQKVSLPMVDQLHEDLSEMNKEM